MESGSSCPRFESCPHEMAPRTKKGKGQSSRGEGSPAARGSRSTNKRAAASDDAAGGTDGGTRERMGYSLEPGSKRARAAAHAGAQGDGSASDDAAPDIATAMLAAAEVGVPGGARARGHVRQPASSGAPVDADGTGEQAVPGARGRVDSGRVDSVRGNEPGPEAGRDDADARSPESGRDGADDEHVDEDEFGGAALARAAKAPRSVRSVADTAPDRRRTKKREARMREREEEENRRERRARRRDMIDDPVLFAQCVVWREGHFSKRQQEWVLHEEDSSEKYLSTARHHERACKALAFWTGAENRATCCMHHVNAEFVPTEDYGEEEGAPMTTVNVRTVKSVNWERRCRLIQDTIWRCPRY
jgi:hypothetical protein